MKLNNLTGKQVELFSEQGYLLLDDVISRPVLMRLKAAFEQWVEESRRYSESYGRQQDGRPRFSVEPDHCAKRPALRRIASPVELSSVYLDVMRNSSAVDAVAQLIGPNIKFNNSKINSKQPGTTTAVEYHQDFMFEPHTNDDLVTVLFFLDDLTADNGPLEVVPGSHRGQLYDHWHNGVFIGSVSKTVAADAKSNAVSCFGPAGSACLMHTRLLHGSAPNLSGQTRTLYITEYCAEDAYPLQSNHIPSRYTGEIVRGNSTNRVRCTSYEMVFPEFPTGASFFEQQAHAENRSAERAVDSP